MPESRRLEWLDAARAFSIVAIILLHLNIWVFPPLYEAFPDMALWKRVMSFTGAFRLPVLFALSGFLVADRVRAGWSDRRNALRAWTSYYLYVVWLAVYASLSGLLPGVQPVGVSWPSFVKQLFAPQTPLWFVMFLAINVVLLTTLHRVHPSIVLTGTAFISWASIRLNFPDDLAMVERGLYYLFFFALGAYGKQALTYFGSWRGLWWRAPVMVMIAIVAIDTFQNERMSLFGYFGAIVLRDISAILCIVAVMSALCLIRPVARVLGFVGSRTLPAYVMHVPLIWLILLGRDALMPVFDIYLLRISAPVLAVVAIIGASIGLQWILTRSPIGRALFEMPPPLRNRILRIRSQHTSVISA
ncbi:acyltransferase family protein [Microbacterium sp. NPDC055683]